LDMRGSPSTGITPNAQLLTVPIGGQIGIILIYGIVRLREAKSV